VKKQLSLGKFDVILDAGVCDARNNADLTLRLKLGFRQINPASGTYNDYGSASGTPRK
jgi:hypothetical protein